MPTRDASFIVQADALSFRHHQGMADALHGVTFSLHKGEVLCLGGVNGSGKSTLLQLLASLLLPTDGRLHLHGLDAATLMKPRHTKIRARSALLLQDADMQILGATVEEDLLIGSPMDQAALEAAQKMADVLGLRHVWHMSPQELSYGQKRKLCLATALLRSPDLLLLDEPLSGLDYPAMKEMLRQLQDLQAKGVAMVISTHDLDMFAQFAKAYLFLSPSLPPLYGNQEQLFPHAATYGIRPPVGYAPIKSWE